MVKLIALFLFFAITAWNVLPTSELRGLLLGLAALVLAVIYFLELIGHPVESLNRRA